MLALMTFSRRLRRWVSGGLMMAVLITQLAIAAYSCPTTQAAAQEAAMAAEMPDCHGMNPASDESRPQLCKAHCSNEAQSTTRALLPDLQPNPASVALLVRVLEPVALASLIQALERDPPLARATESLPLYLSLHVLRN
jgi:hypothetical protein